MFPIARTAPTNLTWMNSIDARAAITKGHRQVGVAK